MPEDIEEYEVVAPAPKSVQIEPKRLRDDHTLTPERIRSTFGAGGIIDMTEDGLKQSVRSLATSMALDLVGEPQIVWRCEIEWQAIRKPPEVPWEEWHHILDAIKERVERGVSPVVISVLALPEEDG